MEILVPELGESIVEATVAKWLKQEGEPVKIGEALVELQTDKVDLEVGAKTEGVLAKITRSEGEDVKVGDVLGQIEPSGSPVQAPAAQPGQAATPAPEPAAAANDRPSGEESNARPGVKPDDGAVEEKVTPVARRMAVSQGIDLSKVPGTGPGERVTKGDLSRYLQQPAGSTSAAAPAAASAPVQAPPAARAPATARPAAEAPAAPAPYPVPAGPGLEVRQKMSRRRRTIAQRLLEAQQNAALLTTFNDVDLSAVMEIRARRKQSFEERHGVRLGFMSFFVKAAIGALKAFPQLNAEIQGDEIVLKQYYDIGVAIGASEGLVVPVLRSADRLSFAEIEQAILNYSQKVKNGTLSLEDLRGGTFSITNGGVFGSLLSTPILNPPQVGILGLHRIEDRPVAVNGQVVIRPMMYLALTYDHRIVDGREAVQFLVKIKELIQDPETLLLEG